MFKRPLPLSPRHTRDVIRVGVDTIPNKGDDDLRYVDEQEGIEDSLGLIPHCINTENHHYCDEVGTGKLMEGHGNLRSAAARNKPKPQ